MELIFISLGIVLLIIFIFLFIRNKKKVNEVEIKEIEKEEKQTNYKKELVVKEEYEFTLIGTSNNAQKTSRSRQMLLMDMGSYDNVILQLERDEVDLSIVVLSEQGYDLGYIEKADHDLLLPYLGKDNYKIESGVERFVRTEEGESLIIYVTVLEYLCLINK